VTASRRDGEGAAWRRATAAAAVAVAATACAAGGGTAGRSSGAAPAARTEPPSDPTLASSRRAELAEIAFDDLRSVGVELSPRDARAMWDILDAGLRRFERDDPCGARWDQAKLGWRQVLRESRRPSDEPDEDPPTAGEPRRPQGITAAMRGEGCRFWPFCS
jgi:hypothetical protein